MEDEPGLRDEFEDDDQNEPDEATLLLEGDEEREGRRRLIIIGIIILLVLLLLFCPIDRDRLRRERSRLLKEKTLADKHRPVGKASYTVISGGPRKEMTNSRKGTPVGIWFYVKNVSRETQVLDTSMVRLRDQFGMEYAAAADLTIQAYKVEALDSPWGQALGPGGSKKVLAMFVAYAGPKKRYYLVGRDFDWASQDTKDYEIGVFDTMPARAYMPPDPP